MKGGGSGVSGIGRALSRAHLHRMGLGLSACHCWKAKSLGGVGGGARV